MHRERPFARAPGKGALTEAPTAVQGRSPGKQTLTEALAPIAAPQATAPIPVTAPLPPQATAPIPVTAPQAPPIAATSTAGAQAGVAPAPVGSPAAYRQRLARPGYLYLGPHAEPLVAQLAHAAPTGQVIDQQVIGHRLDAMFRVSHTAGVGELAAAKQASNHYHAELGARVAAQLDERVEREAPDGEAPPELAPIARRLERETDELLEDDVHLSIEPDEAGAGIRIAPNDFWARWYGALRTRGPRGHTALDRRGRAQLQADVGLLGAANAMFIAVATAAAGEAAQVQLAAASKYAFALPNNLAFSIRLLVCPLGDKVIRPIANPTKHDHVLEISDRAARDDLGRAIAHGVGEIAAIERQSVNRAFPVEIDLLTRQARDGQQTALSPRDHGAIAQLHQLHTAYNVGNTPTRNLLRRELMLLIDDLGIRRGTPDGNARFTAVRPHLAGIADWIESLARPEGELNGHQVGALTGARQQYDVESQTAKREEIRTQPLHTVPLEQRRKSLKSAKALAQAAARARNQKSAQTEATYRGRAVAAQQHNQLHAVPNPMIGGGASLAAVRPGTFLVDDRGRWQVDPSKEIAQTAAQLRWVVEAGLGDPFDFVEHPDDRVPLEAVRYWEDTIAAQADVINGRAELTLDGHSRMVLTIRPSSNGGNFQLEVAGNPVVATGFPRESAPLPTQRGNVRVSVRWALEQLITVLGGGLQGVNGAPELLARLRAVDAGNDAAVAAAYFQAPAPLRLQLSQHGQPAQGQQPEDPVRQAHAILAALETWATARQNQPTRVLTGDEANSQLVDRAVRHWVIGGVGGTAISAAEIILDNNPEAWVTMVGGNVTAGLADNDQFKRVWRVFGPTGQGRFEVIGGQRITSLGHGNNHNYTAGQALTSQRRLESGEVAQNVDQPLTWLVRAEVALLGEAQRILEGNPQSRVTLFGAANNARFTGNQALIALFARFGPTSGDRRLQVISGPYAEHATQAQPNGEFALDAPVTGGGFIVSMGRDDQMSPVIDSMVRAAKLRDPNSVSGDLMWDDDGQYIGYRVNIIAIDHSVKHIEVTGAASRFFPPGVFTAQQEQAARTGIRDSISHDAPEESGNFAGGFGASALQTARFARQRRHEQERRIVAQYLQAGGDLPDLPGDQRGQWATLLVDHFAGALPADRDRVRVVDLNPDNLVQARFEVSLGEVRVGVLNVQA